ncbi:hypothetical protein [Nocardia abscessus]|uniref:hypothetical protein n=1 Tax=Nocardia abscessus TaxID=120957 RepID=UPI002457DAD1|nr:hypothetical protein [Nocardia abscessus]
MTISSPTMTPAALIAGGRMSSYQRRIVALCLAVAFIDGFDARAVHGIALTA